MNLPNIIIGKHNNNYVLNFKWSRQNVELIKQNCLGVSWNPVVKKWVCEELDFILDLERNNIPYTINPEVQQDYINYKQRLNNIRHLRQTVPKNELYAYQEIGSSILHAQRRGILADEMGLGKTKQALDAFVGSGCKKGLVLTSKSLLTKWQQEVQKFHPHLATHIVSDVNRAFDWIQANDGLLLSNYEKIRTNWPTHHKWDCVIFDEAHRFKNSSTQLHKCAMAISKCADYVWGLTGTPIQLTPYEMWAVMRVVRPSVYGSYTRFRNAHIEEVFERGRITQIIKNRDLFVERSVPWVLRRTKQEVAPYLPPKIYSIKWFELSHPEQKAYNKLDQYIGAQDPHIMILRHQQFTSSPMLVGIEEFGRGSKFEALKQLLATHSGKSLIFTRFAVMANYLVEWLELESWQIITGQIASSNVRHHRITQFNSTPSAKVFVCTDAASHGLDIAADLVIHYDRLWNPASEWQREDRCHGIGRGTGEPINVVYMLAANTIDQTMHNVCSKRKDFIGEISDAWLRDALAQNWQQVVAGDWLWMP